MAGCFLRCARGVCRAALSRSVLASGFPSRSQDDNEDDWPMPAAKWNQGSVDMRHDPTPSVAPCTKPNDKKSVVDGGG